MSRAGLPLREKADVPVIRKRAIAIFSLTLLSAGVGCAAARNEHRIDPNRVAPQAATIVVAPVLNLSGSPDFDPLRLTDIVASECVSFQGISVVPVNLTLAALQRRGQMWVRTPAEAIALADDLGADATVVVAVTEFSPYDPPTAGLIGQWYPASDSATSAVYTAGSSGTSHAQFSPTLQAQRVFNADDQLIVREMQEFAKLRDGNESPFGWRKYAASQELYLHYCAWSLIRSMLRVQDAGTDSREPIEANAMATPTGCLSLVKGQHQFVFRYAPGREADLLARLVMLADDPDSPFDWLDAAVLSYQLGQRMEQNLESVG